MSISDEKKINDAIARAGYDYVNMPASLRKDIIRIAKSFAKKSVSKALEAQRRRIVGEDKVDKVTTQ